MSNFTYILGNYFHDRPITLVFFAEENREKVNKAVVAANAQVHNSILIREYNLPSFVARSVDVNLFFSFNNLHAEIDNFLEEKSGRWNGKRVYLWLTIIDIDLIYADVSKKQRLHKFLASNDIDHVLVSVLQEKMYQIVDIDEVIDFLSGEKFNGNQFVHEDIPDDELETLL